MVERIDTSIVYKACDGQIFKNEKRCKEYEEGVISNGIKNRDNLIAAIEAENLSCACGPMTPCAPEFLELIKSTPDSRSWAVMKAIYYSHMMFERRIDDGYQQLEALLLEHKDSIN